MSGLPLLRIALAAVFAVAAVGKLADRSGTRAALKSFGLPGRAAAPIAIALPLAELAVATALLVPATAVAGAIGALGLLAVFSAAIAVNLARGRRPDCHCFGQVHSKPIGAGTLLRNAGLAIAAGLTVVLGREDAGPSALAWVTSSPGVALAAGLAAGLAAALWVAFALLRRHGRALRRVDELEAALREAGLEVPEPAGPAKLPIGAAAPAFAGMPQILAAGRPLVAVFTSPGCGPCRELAPKLASWREAYAELLAFAELSFDDEPALAARFGVEGTPAAIVIGAEGRVESRVAHGPGAIESLVEETVLECLPAPPDVGEPLPDLTLETLSAERASLRSLVADDRDTLVLFWDPSCGFCSSMRDELRKLDESSADGHPALLVVSAGDGDEVREEGFRSRVLLDPFSIASSALGAGGTPAAVLVGPGGVIRLTIAEGRRTVLELAGVEDGGDEARLEVVAVAASG